MTASFSNQAAGANRATGGQARPGETEASILQVYQTLKSLLARNDLAPATRANLVEALAAVSLVVQDLALDYEMLYDLGV